MQLATTRQTLDGITFETEGFQPLVSKMIKNYILRFENEGVFTCLVRMVDENNYLALRYDGLNVWAEEMDKGNQKILGMKEMGGASNWVIESKEGYVSIQNGETRFVLPYLKIMDGSVGIYAVAGETFANMGFELIVPDFTYKGEGIAFAEAGRLHLKGNYGPYGVIADAGSYTLTVEYKGDVTLQLGEESKSYQGEGRAFLTNTIGAGEEWRVFSNGEAEIEGIQLESGNMSNMVLGSGESLGPSELSFPTKNNLYEKGSILLDLVSFADEAETSKVFVCGNMSVTLSGGAAFFNVGASSCSTAIVGGKNIVLRASYDEKGIEIKMSSENGVSSAKYVGETEVLLGQEFRLTDAQQFEGGINHLVLWKRRMSVEEIDVGVEQMTKSFESDFEDVISSKEKTFIEGTLAPVDGSPILVEDEMGALNRVNFFDFETAEYRTFNEEEIVYDGESDFLVISYDSLDETNFKVQIYAGDVLVSEQASVSGKKVYLVFSEEEKRKYLGETLMVRYQVERSYVLDYQRAAMDSYRVYLTKHQGEEVSVTQEGSRRYRNRLSKEIELNPTRNSQSEGFLYVSDKEQEIKGLRVFMSPSTLVANGMETCLLTIEPIDEEGNEVLGASLMVTTDRGVLEPVVSGTQAKIRSTGGRYLYRYHAPYISESEAPRGAEAKILVRDRKTGIGQSLSLFMKGATTEQRNVTTPDVEIDAQIVFEYVAKCFKRDDAVAKWVEIIDVNNDGRVDECEIDWLRQNMSSSEMKRMAARLREGEGAV